MKKRLILILFSTVLLVACAFFMDGWQKPEFFQNKTGVVGVVRSPAGACRWAAEKKVYPGTLKLGTKTTYLGTSDEIGDVFFASQTDPGTLKLHKYEYKCIARYNTKCSKDACYDEPVWRIEQLVPSERVAVKVPVSGFCKIVLSFRDGSIKTEKDDAFLEDFFVENKVAIEADDLPYCEVE